MRDTSSLQGHRRAVRNVGLSETRRRRSFRRCDLVIRRASQAGDSRSGQPSFWVVLSCDEPCRKADDLSQVMVDEVSEWCVVEDDELAREEAFFKDPPDRHVIDLTST